MPSDQFNRLVTKRATLREIGTTSWSTDQDCEVPRASDYNGMSTQFAVHALIVYSFLFSGMQLTGILFTFIRHHIEMSQWSMGLSSLLSGA